MTRKYITCTVPLEVNSDGTIDYIAKMASHACVHVYLTRSTCGAASARVFLTISNREKSGRLKAMAYTYTNVK